MTSHTFASELLKLDGHKIALMRRVILDAPPSQLRDIAVALLEDHDAFRSRADSWSHRIGQLQWMLDKVREAVRE